MKKNSYTIKEKKAAAGKYIADILNENSKNSTCMFKSCTEAPIPISLFSKNNVKNKLSLNDKVYYWSYNSFIEGIRYNKQTNFKHSPIKSVSTFLGFWYN